MLRWLLIYRIMQKASNRRSSVLTRGALIVLMCYAGVAAPAGGWPVFRGNPALTGVAAGTLPAKPSLLWTFKTGGPVKSSAVISGGKVFIGSNDGQIRALEFASGRQLWAFKAGSAVLAPPLLANNALFAGDMDGDFYSINAADGRQLWKFSAEGKIVGSANAVPNGDGPPRILVGSYDFKLYCFDATNPTPVWTYETGNYINGSCAVAGGQVVFGGCDAMVHVLNASTGAKVKEIDAGAYIAASVALAGNRAYVGHYENEFLCVDLDQGKVAWRFHDRDFPFMASAAVTEQRVLFGGDDKVMHCLERAGGKEVWKFPTRGKIESSPVVAGGKIVFGSDDGTLYMLSLAEGKELWSYEIGQAATGSPAVADEKIVIGADDGGVYCFGQKS
jgi:outer membrane protein assembly factor BamB